MKLYWHFIFLEGCLSKKWSENFFSELDAGLAEVLAMAKWKSSFKWAHFKGFLMKDFLWKARIFCREINIFVLLGFSPLWSWAKPLGSLTLFRSKNGLRKHIQEEKKRILFQNMTLKFEDFSFKTFVLFKLSL